MLLRRATVLPKSLKCLRLYSSAEAATVLEQTVQSELSYLPGFPRPDPKFGETILAVPRSASGRSIARKEREAGLIPSIIFEHEDGKYSGNKTLMSVRTSQITKLITHQGPSFFLSRLFDVEVRPEFESSNIIEKVRVLPRALRMNAETDVPWNVTFVRAPVGAFLKVDVPLVFRGEDVSPGLQKGGHLNTIKTTVKIHCPAEIIPPYIDVDLSELDIEQKIVMGDLKVHPALKLVQSKDQPVVKIMGAKASDPEMIS